MIGVTSQQVPLNNGWPQKVLLHRCCGAASWGNFNKGRDGRHVTACRATCWLSQRWWWWGCIRGGFDDFDDFDDTLNQGKGGRNGILSPGPFFGERLRHQHRWHSWLAGILEPTLASLRSWLNITVSTKTQLASVCSSAAPFRFWYIFNFKLWPAPNLSSILELRRFYFRESFVQDGSGDCNHSVYLKAFTLHRLDFSRRDISQIVPSLFSPPQHT